jgi:hypothetical protein
MERTVFTKKVEVVSVNDFLLFKHFSIFKILLLQVMQNDSENLKIWFIKL